MKPLLFALLLGLTSVTQAATVIAGMRFEDKASLGDAELQLNGAGLRSRFFVNVYAVGLYLPEKKRSAGEALAATGAKRLQMRLLRDLPATQFADALLEAFRKNHEGAELDPLKPRLEELKANVLLVNIAHKGDVIDIDWLPNQGTRLAMNGKTLGKDIAGEDFYRALMKAWLGAKPVQDTLKDALLGKPQ